MQHANFDMPQLQIYIGQSLAMTLVGTEMISYTIQSILAMCEPMVLGHDLTGSTFWHRPLS